MTTTASPHQPGGLSALFSLSQAAASAPPIPVGQDTSKALKEKESKELLSGKQAHVLKHRRLSSTGQRARRMSDARDAVTRTGPTNLQIAASALSSLASLSLSAASAVPAPVNIPIRHTRSRSQVDGQDLSLSPSSFDANLHFGSLDLHMHNLGALASSVPNPSFMYAASSVGDDIEVDVEDDMDDNVSVIESAVGHGDRKTKKVVKDSKPAKGKKRGTIFKCESCSKVYRHPSCLVKHRWEHSPHWREASKFLLSKHQQVQLLEAAAILTHLDPGSSLPEDRSQWPSYLSGGLLPPPSSSNPKDVTAKPSSLGSGHSVPIRAIAPRMGRTRSGSTSTTTSSGAGPRMHDFKIQGGITQIRPGVLAHPTLTTATIVPPGTSISPYANEDRGSVLREVKEEEPFSLSISSPSKPQPMAVRSKGSVFGSKYSGSFVENGFTAYRDAGLPGSTLSGVSFDSSALSSGWSLPRSDLRSGSVVSGDEDVENISMSPDPEDIVGNGLDDDNVSSASKSGSDPASLRFSRGGSTGPYGSYGTFGSYDSYGSRASPDSHPEYEYPKSDFTSHVGNGNWKKDQVENHHMVVREDEWEGMAVDMDL